MEAAGGGERWTGPKTRGSFICPKVFIADRGISRRIGDGTFPNGHCGTVTELNVIWIQRLIMKRKERRRCSVESMPPIRKERITYRCLVLPPSPHVSHRSLIGWMITSAPPSSNGRCTPGRIYKPSAPFLGVRGSRALIYPGSRPLPSIVYQLTPDL